MRKFTVTLISLTAAVTAALTITGSATIDTRSETAAVVGVEPKTTGPGKVPGDETGAGLVAVGGDGGKTAAGGQVERFVALELVTGKRFDARLGNDRCRCQVLGDAPCRQGARALAGEMTKPEVHEPISALRVAGVADELLDLG